MGLPKRQLRRWATRLLLLVPALAAAAPPAAGWGAGLYTGACELAEDPAESSGESLGLCLRGAAGGELAIAAGAPAENAWMNYANGYAGLFISSWLSFQGRAFWRDEEPLGKHAGRIKDLEPDYAVMQLGSPVLSHVRVTAGRSRLPFGIDTTLAPQLYQLEENRLFWESPHDTVYLTLDDMRQLKFEAGLATNDVDRRRHATARGAPQPTENAVSARAAVDVAALEGTRLTASGYSAKNGERRFGAGVINQNRRGDGTAFEFVRRLTTPDGKAAPFEQLLRLTYASAFARDQRWVIQIDDERDRFRRGFVDRDLLVHDHVLCRFGVGYTKSEDGVSPNRWALLTGLEAQL